MFRPEPFVVDVAEGVLADLRERIRRTRWPRDLDDGSWRLGADLAFLRALLQFWSDDFDWREVERRLNRFPQFRVDIEGASTHFVHLRATGAGSSGEPAIPILLGHGWPNTFADLLDLARRLTDPTRFGADPSAPVFDVVIPSLPGYAFSTLPDRPFSWREVPGMGVQLMAG